MPVSIPIPPRPNGSRSRCARRQAARLARLACLLLACALPACGPRGGAEEKEAPAAEESGAKHDSNRVELPAGAAEGAGIRVGLAGPAEIEVTVELPGEVKADSARVLFVRPRFAGVIHAMRKKVGDLARKGETVAIIQSNESLTDYVIASSLSGRVVASGGAVGQAVGTDATLYTIVDLSDVWVDFPVYPHQLGSIRRGQQVHIARQTAGAEEALGTISTVGALLSEDARTSVARIVLPNRDGRWEPGLFVNATVVLDHARVAVAVPDEAIVRTGDGSGVFVLRAGGFDLREVETGRTDGRTTEITSGLAAGDSVVVRNPFVLKSELEKEEE